jgi:hypothetical protein
LPLGSETDIAGDPIRGAGESSEQLLSFAGKVGFRFFVEFNLDWLNPIPPLQPVTASRGQRGVIGRRPVFPVR